MDARRRNSLRLIKDGGGENLSELSYRQLQVLAKEKGIPANQSTADLIAALS